MEPNGKTVWITGASSGIGEALAYAMAGAGARLILSARNEERLTQVKARCLATTPDVTVLPLDIADHASLPQKAEEAKAHFGSIDILVNNAGLGQRGAAADTVFDVDRRIMDVNFFGPVCLTKAILPDMLERKTGQIVVTSSVFGKFGGPTRTAYAASKHALMGWFDSLRAEVHESGLVVTILCPGYIHTNISLHALESNGQPHAKMDKGQIKGLTADECARRMLRVIRKNKSEAYIGGIVEVGGVYLKRWCPSLFEYVIRKVKIN